MKKRRKERKKDEKMEKEKNETKETEKSKRKKNGEYRFGCLIAILLLTSNLKWAEWLAVLVRTLKTWVRSL